MWSVGMWKEGYVCLWGVDDEYRYMPVRYRVWEKVRGNREEKKNRVEGRLDTDTHLSPNFLYPYPYSLYLSLIPIHLYLLGIPTPLLYLLPIFPFPLS